MAEERALLHYSLTTGNSLQAAAGTTGDQAVDLRSGHTGHTGRGQTNNSISITLCNKTNITALE